MIESIPNFPGYSVDTNGNVYTRWKKQGRNPAIICGIYRKMRPTIAREYKLVTLFKNGKPYYKKVHHLVLETFVGPCPDGMEACHDNNNKLDNSSTNLYWGTKSRNYQDRRKNNTTNDGERNGRAKLTNENVLEIRRRLTNGEKQIPLSIEFGVSQNKISQIKRRVNWKHI